MTSPPSSFGSHVLHSYSDSFPTRRSSDLFGESIFGTINRWVIRPTFNFLLAFVPSQGIVILLLTLLVKIVLFPLSYKMLGSQDRKSTRLNSSHLVISYAVFCLKINNKKYT